MSMTTESPEFSERYDAKDKDNLESFYLTDADRPFDVFMTVHSIGEPRVEVRADEISAEQLKELQRMNKAALVDHEGIESGEVQYLKQAGIAARFLLGGNMSTVVRDGEAAFGPKDLSSDERLADARKNMNEHFATLGVDPATVRILNPERDYSTPLTAINVDEDTGVYNGLDPVRLEKSGDFIYSYNPDIVLAVRPADCPIAIMSAETPNGKVNIMLHFAWKGPAAGQYDDMKRELDNLGVDYETLKVYITPGGHSETFRYKGYVSNGGTNPDVEESRLFVGVTEDPETGKQSFGIDTPNDVYEAFVDMGLDKKQLFLDTSDTTALNSGYASNSRAFNQKEDDARDLVTAVFHA